MAANYILSEGLKKLGGRESFKNYVKTTYSDILKKDPYKYFKIIKKLGDGAFG